MQKNPLLKSNFKHGFGKFTTALLCLLVVFAVFRLAMGIVYFKVYVVGTSMEGTLTGANSKGEAGGDYVYAFQTSSPRRGDIIVIETDADDEPIIKRLIALGGDKVMLDKGVLYVNGVKVDEPYVKAENNSPNNPVNTFGEFTVPEGHMFFMGDNRNVSVDSRSAKYGTVPVGKLMGVVADWSLAFKGFLTKFNSFFDFKVARVNKG